jgi:hypothetical protein
LSTLWFFALQTFSSYPWPQLFPFLSVSSCLPSKLERELGDSLENYLLYGFLME